MYVFPAVEAEIFDWSFKFDVEIVTFLVIALW